MTNSLDSQLMLEDLLADLKHARKAGALGRLALLAYCDTKGWARQAGKPDIADKALKMFTETPCLTREAFLQGIDELIATLDRHLVEYQRVQRRFLPIYPSSKSLTGFQ